MEPSSDAPTPVPQSPVDRQRRYFFTSRVVAFCLMTSAMFTAAGMYHNTSTPLMVNFVDGMLGLANVVTLAYISGSVIDYNGALAGLFARKTV